MSLIKDTEIILSIENIRNAIIRNVFSKLKMYIWCRDVHLEGHVGIAIKVAYKIRSFLIIVKPREINEHYSKMF